MKQRELKVHFNAPGFKSQEIDIAPAIDASPSKRKPVIENEVRTGRSHSLSTTLSCFPLTLSVSHTSSIMIPIGCCSPGYPPRRQFERFRSWY